MGKEEVMGVGHRLLVLISLMFLILSFPLVSQAEEEGGGWRFGVTPRLWISAATIPDEDNVSNGTVLLPLYGATLSVTPGFAPNLSVLATAFHGSNDGDGVFLPTRTDGTLDMERTDIEVLLRYVFPGTGINIHAGGRFVRFITEFEADSGTFDNRDETELWLGEVGVGLVREISEDGHHRLFANLTGVLGNGDNDFKDSQGFRSSDSDLSVGADINVGYQWWVTTWANVGLRYRSFVLTTENDFDLDKFVSIHGPEASIGLVF